MTRYDRDHVAARVAVVKSLANLCEVLIRSSVGNDWTFDLNEWLGKIQIELSAVYEMVNKDD